MEKYNEIAAKWWTDLITNIRITDYDIGENDENTMLASLLWADLALHSKPSYEKAKKFEKNLAKAIEKEVEKNRKNDFKYRLSSR